MAGILTRRSLMMAALPASLLAQQRATPKLNVVLILVDDMGLSDLGCYDSKFYKTPHIDKLAASGMRFTQAYSACTVCSPSRAAIMTGKYPARLHITNWIPGHDYAWARLRPPAWTQHLPLQERTIAEALKPAGYTSASIGKWHLTPVSSDKAAFYPEKQGFDRNVAGSDRGSPPSYFSPYQLDRLTDGPKGEYLTDREQMEASRFIRENKDRPFFVYLPHYTVHTPLQPKSDLLEKYKATADPRSPQHNPAYAAMIESLDDNVGRLMKTLQDTGVADRTVVIFTSDNGGWLPSTNTNLGVRAGKGSAYEGGVRVPLIVRYPGVVPAGSSSDIPVIGPDLYPTILELAGARPEAAQVIDGVSLLPVLKSADPAALPARSLFWHYPHYHPGGAAPYSAIRRDNWKLIEFHEDKHVELYDLSKDPLEASDLAAKQPARVKDLRKRLQEWREETGAQMPTPNPEHDPNREQERRPA